MSTNNVRRTILSGFNFPFTTFSQVLPSLLFMTTAQSESLSGSPMLFLAERAWMAGRDWESQS